MKPWKDLVTSFVRGWNFARSETLEILDFLDDEKLLFCPKGEKWQPVYFQFMCIGRSQMVNTQAIITGKKDFSLYHSDFVPEKLAFKTKDEIRNFLEKADKEWVKAIRAKREDEDFLISWPGFNANLMVQISHLISHERLHHGQLIAYFTMAGWELPENFKKNWAL